MNIQQRLAALERHALATVPKAMPAKPSDWSDGEYKAVVNGLGVTGAITLNRAFIDKYRAYIEQIRADYNEQGIIPDKPLVKAQPLTYAEIIEHDKARYCEVVEKDRAIFFSNEDTQVKL